MPAAGPACDGGCCQRFVPGLCPAAWAEVEPEPLGANDEEFGDGAGVATAESVRSDAQLWQILGLGGSGLRMRSSRPETSARLSAIPRAPPCCVTP